MIETTPVFRQVAVILSPALVDRPAGWLYESGWFIGNDWWGA